MAEESPRTVSATVLKAFQEIAETNKEILKLFEVIEERKRQHEGVRGETKQEEAQRAANGLQNVQSELIAKLTSTNEEQTTKKSNVVEQVVTKSTLRVDKSLDSGVNADHKTNKEVRNSAKPDETGDTQLVNDVGKENEKACSADRNAGVTDQSLLTNEQKIFGQCLKSRKSVPLISDNRFQTALDNGVISREDSASNTSATVQKKSTVTVTSKGKETVSKVESKLQEAFSSDTEEGEVDENTIIHGTVESKEVINLGDVKEISDEEIQRQLENLENIPHREPEEKKRVIIDLEKWDEYANEEVKKGQLAKEMHLNGVDTIFCLDISMSMKGKPLQQAKAFIHNCIEDLQNTEVTDETYEHVALVTFGHETKVQQHLSYEYFQLLTKLEHLQADGPSPLFAGLKMCWAALQGAGIVPSSPDDKFHPKVYLLSDGSVTPSSFVAGPDSCNAEGEKMEQDQVTKYCTWLYREFHLVINVVSVGDKLTDLQEEIAKKTEGKLITSGSWIFTAQTHENNLTLGGKIDDDDQRSVEDKNEEEDVPFYQSVTSLLPDFLTQTSDLHDESDEERSIESDTDEEIENSLADSLANNVPPCGTRVKRKEGEIFGTVTKCHARGVTVTWDEERRISGRTGDFMDPDSIEIVNQPRLLKDELIAIGCKVKRGPDWHYGNQDGSPGSEGTVYKVEDTGIAKVVWENGDKKSYRFGVDGKFDLEILEAERPIHMKNTSKNKANVRMAHKTVNTAHVKGIEGSQNSETGSGVTSSQSFTWRWKDSVGAWKTYPDDLNKHIEASYWDNPNGTLLFTYLDTQYKILFKRMAKLEVNTGEKYPVFRRQL